MHRFKALLSELSEEYDRLSEENRALAAELAGSRDARDACVEREGCSQPPTSSGSSGTLSTLDSHFDMDTPRLSFFTCGRGVARAEVADQKTSESLAAQADVGIDVGCSEMESPRRSFFSACKSSLRLEADGQQDLACSATKVDPSKPEVPEGRALEVEELPTLLQTEGASESSDSLCMAAATQEPGKSCCVSRALDHAARSICSRRRQTFQRSTLRLSWQSIAWTDFLINPEQSQFLQHWNIIAMTALAFVAIVTPIQISMLKTVEVDALFFVNCIVDLIFLCDLGMQFFIMYPKSTDYGFELERRPIAIVNNYLRTWFPVDLISVIPFDLLSFVSDSEGSQTMKVIKVVRLLRLLKLVRVLKASRLIRRLEVRSSISYGRLDLLKFFVILLMIAHWLANLWALTLVLVDEGEGVPRWIDGFDELEKNVAAKTKDTPWKLYVTCLYFTTYTMTSVGYGDIGPANIVETVVATMMVIVSGISWAIVLGQVCGIVANLESHEQEFRQTMDELNFMMRDRVMPLDLRQRLRSFFLSNKMAQKRAKHDRIMDSMSPGLRGEVVMEINRRWIANVSFLNQFIVEAGSSSLGSVFSAFIVEVSQQMQLSVHAQSEIFGAPHELYIMIRGLATHGLKLRRTGSVWGADFVLSDTTLLEPAESFALTYVELTALKREPFLQLVEKYRTACPELKRRVRRFCGWLALQRAILREARRRRRQQQQRQLQGGSGEREAVMARQTSPSACSATAVGRATSKCSSAACSEDQWRHFALTVSERDDALF